MNENIKEVVAFMKEKGVTIEELKDYFNEKKKTKFSLVVDDVHNIWGPVVCGRIDDGILFLNMKLSLVKGQNVYNCKCVAIEKYRKIMKVGLRGDYVAIKLSGVDYKDIKRGMTLVSADRSPDED